MKLSTLEKLTDKFKLISDHKYISFDDLILNGGKSKISTIKHIIKYHNNYYSIKVHDNIEYSEQSNCIINKNFNLEITKVGSSKKFITSNKYEYNIKFIKSFHLIINGRVINIDSAAIKYNYNNFIHKKLDDLLYITINLEKTDISEFLWSSDIENLLLENKFEWETSIGDLIINQGCPLFGTDRSGAIRILGIYYCRTIDSVNNEHEPLLWFIPSYTILLCVSQIYNKQKISYENNIINNYEIKDNQIILTENYKITHGPIGPIIIPKNSTLISYNDKMLLYGNIIKDKINIKFITYQNYDPIERVFFKYNNKYYIRNIEDYKIKDRSTRIPLYYNYNTNKSSYYNYKGFIFMKLSLQFINYILSCNLIIDSYYISQIINDPKIELDQSYTYCLLSCPDKYYDKLDNETYLYKVLSNLLFKYIHITKYLDDRPQTVYVPIIKGNINEPIKSLTLLIDSDSAYTLNL